jgi:hypothetical protein
MKTITLVAIASLFIGCGNSIKEGSRQKTEKRTLP